MSAATLDSIKKIKASGRNAGVHSPYVPVLDNAVSVYSIREGLDYSSLLQLKSHYRMSSQQISDLLQIPSQTMQRRKNEGRLTKLESERIARFAEILVRATELLEDEAAAVEWLQKPSPALKGTTPLELSDTEQGAKQVLILIGQLEHGISP